LNGIPRKASLVSPKLGKVVLIDTKVKRTKLKINLKVKKLLRSIFFNI
jgi:hypothetical protein